ncbi:MAG: hypothetical protein AAF270_14055 [Pseudomonadota bacterium]
MTLALPQSAAGDSLRLMSVFCDAEQRERLRVGWRLRTDILATATASEQPEICRTKLAWWHEEISRLFEGRARHPSSVAFSQHHPTDSQTRLLVEQWLVAAHAQIAAHAIDDTTEFRISAFRHYGAILMLLDTSTETRDRHVDGARECAVALELLDTISAGATAVESTAFELVNHSIEAVADIGNTSNSPAHAALSAILCLRLQRIDSARSPNALRLLLSAWWHASRSAKRIVKDTVR